MRWKKQILAVRHQFCPWKQWKILFEEGYLQFSSQDRWRRSYNEFRILLVIVHISVQLEPCIFFTLKRTRKHAAACDLTSLNSLFLIFFFKVQTQEMH